MPSLPPAVNLVFLDVAFGIWLNKQKNGQDGGNRVMEFYPNIRDKYAIMASSHGVFGQ